MDEEKRRRCNIWSHILYQTTRIGIQCTCSGSTQNIVGTCYLWGESRCLADSHRCKDEMMTKEMKIKRSNNIYTETWLAFTNNRRPTTHRSSPLVEKSSKRCFLRVTCPPLASCLTSIDYVPHWTIERRQLDYGAHQTAETLILLIYPRAAEGQH